MIQGNSQGDYPKIHKTAYIHPTAVIIGKVKIGKNVFVAPGVIIRADEKESSIVIGDNCNVQDRVIIHALGGSSVCIGESVSLSHGCIIHGPCKIGKNSFIGFASVIFKAKIGDSCYIGQGAVIEGVNIMTERVVEPGEVLRCQDDIRKLQYLDKDKRIFMERVVKVNLELCKGYKNEEGNILR